MMAKPVVFVIGATGTIGSATVQALSSRYADKLEIRAGVRDPDKAGKLKGLAGVTVVKAEMGAKDALVNTLRGVDALYIVGPNAESRTQLVVTTAEAAKEAGVKFILALSASTAPRMDLRYGQQFGAIEASISALGVPYAIFRLPWFYENYFGFKGSIVGESTIRLAVDPDMPQTPIAVEDAAKAAAAILADPAKHHSKIYHLVSDRFTFRELTALFSASLGREIKYDRVSYEVGRKLFIEWGFPESVIDNAVVVWFHLVDSGSLIANEPDMSHFEQITGEKPTSIRTWVSQVAAAFKA